MASKCPFHNLWASRGASKTDLEAFETVESEKGDQSVAVTAAAPATDHQRVATSPPTVDACPFTAASAAPPAAVAAPHASCPLGFGAASGLKLSPFHCPLCRCLFYGPVATKPCGHRFCAGCIRGARDCPICGADIVKAEPAAELQEQVETYIQAHAASHTLWELEATSAGSGANVEEPQVGVDADGSKVERSRAVFLLALGLRALSAGNIDAAAARLGQSAAELETQLEEDGGDGLSTAGNTADKRTEMLHLRLGTVYGALGDISRRAGDAPVALQRYEQSLQQLERAGGDAAALDARAVTVSKLGELRHLSGDLAAAAEAYHRALDLRRCALARLEPTAASSSIGGQADEHMAAILGVAASLIKLADVQQSLAQTTASGSKGDGPAPSPAVLLAEAGELLARLKGGTGAGVLSPALQRKLAAIEQYVQG